MSAAVSRELKITYGSMVVGGTTDYLIWGPWKLTPYSYGSVSVEFMVLVTSTTESGFAAARAAVENAFRTPRQRLKIELGSSTLRDFDPSTNSGFDAEAEIRDDGPPESTGRSRLYKVRISVKLPADLTGQNGLSESEIELEYSPSGVRTLTVSGTYTATTAPLEARANYEAHFATYVAGKVSGELGGGTFELVRKQATTGDTNKVCRFRHTYEEVIFAQSVGALDDATLTQPSLNINRREVTTPSATSEDLPAEAKAGGSQEKEPEITPSEFMVDISYDVNVDKSVTNLYGKWTDTIKPFLLSVLSTYVLGGTSILESVDPGFDPVRNRISARISARVYRGGNLLKFTIRTTDDLDTGTAIIETHGSDPFSAYTYSGKAKLIRTIRRSSLVIGEASDPKLTSFFKGRSTPSAGWILLRRTPEREPKFIGLFGGYKDVYQLDETLVMRWVVAPGSSSGTGTRSR